MGSLTDSSLTTPDDAPRLSADTRLARPLVPLALAVLIGIGVGELVETLPVTAIVLLVAFFALQRLAGRFLPQNLVFGVRLWAVVMAAALFVIVRPTPSTDSTLTDADPAKVEAVLDAPVRHAPDWATTTANAVRIQTPLGERSLPGRVRLGGPSEVFEELRQGDRVRVTADFRPPRGFRNPGLFNYGDFLVRQGITATATVKKGALERIGHEESILFDAIGEWRERIRAAALASLPQAPAAVFLAMITGETGYLTADLRDRFMASGTVHLLSISGSHLGLIALVVFTLVRWAVRRLPARLLLRVTLHATPSQIAAVVTVIPVTFYALLAGAQVATLRALLMIGLYLVAVIIHREDDLLTALALAAVLILLWEPHALLDVSFQLSFLSVLCIAVGTEWWRNRFVTPVEDRVPTWWSRMRAKAALLMVVSIAATVGTAPLTAYHFNQLNWVGIVANPIIIPLAGVLIVPLGLACALAGAIGGMATLPLASLNTAGLDLLLWAVDGFASWPLAIVHVAAPSIAAVALVYLIVAMGLDRRLSPWKRGLAGGVLVLLLVPWLLGTPHWTGNTSLEVTFLDVGQGDGAIVRFPSGHVMVVDGGTRFHELDVGRLVVAPMLWNQGTRHIDYLVASHPQLDHIGGLIYLAETFAVGQVWTNGDRTDLWASQRLEEVIAARDIPEVSIEAKDQPLWIGAARVWHLNPPSALPPEDRDGRVSENDQSIVLRVEYGRASVLLTGDLEAAGERSLADVPWINSLLRTTVMKVPHHGSRGALDSSFLHAASPRVAVVSVGATNTYGHPTPQMLNAYKRLRAAVLRTDRDGAVRLITDGTHVALYRYEDLTSRPVPWNHGMLAAEWTNLRTLLGSPVPAMVIDLSKTEPPLF